MPRSQRKRLLVLILGALGIFAAAAFVVVVGRTPAPGTTAVYAAEDAPDEGNKTAPGLRGRGRTRDGRTIADAPPFTVPDRADALDYFPCSDCHEGEPVNPRERELEEEHDDIVLSHGAGRFWCLTCHNIARDPDTFVSLKGQPIDFNAAYLLCGQCHFERQLDWYFGGHGKRVGAFPDPRRIPATFEELKVEERESIGTWQGERKILSCPACHNPHSPAIRPFQPSPPPQVRKGLERNPHPEAPRPRIWERMTPISE